MAVLHKYTRKGQSHFNSQFHRHEVRHPIVHHSEAANQSLLQLKHGELVTHFGNVNKIIKTSKVRYEIF